MDCYLRALALELPGSFRRDAGLIVLILAYSASGVAVASWFGASVDSSIDLYLPIYWRLLPLMLLTLLALHALHIVLVLRPRRPLQRLWADLMTSLATPRRVAHALPCLIFIPLFGGSFTLVKSAIPLLHPFAWDLQFERWDRWLHGGVAPWELLQPILNLPIATYAIDWSYNLWLAMLSICWVWQAFNLRDPRLRAQFLWSLIATWIVVGNAAALFFSSAGPCYFGRIVGLPDPYAPLMAYLHDADRSFTISALGAQNLLWDAYSLHRFSAFAGISAMPSMHVASATLFALLGWRTARWLRIVFTVFFCLILIGSVHLGWHYAIDGYAGALGAALIWWITGRILHRTSGAARDTVPADAY